MKERYQKIVFQAEEGIELVCTKGTRGELIVKAVYDMGVIDEYFMEISSEERNLVRRWLRNQKGQTKQEKEFLTIVKEGLEKVNYDYEIATIEPSIINHRIRFIEGEKVAVGHSPNEWLVMCKNYAPKRGSRMAKLYELFIWYAWRIAKGYWSLDYVANDSSSAGNYGNAPDASHYVERSAVRTCGGFKDGQGNTYKIVVHQGKLVSVGGSYRTYGSYYPVSEVCNSDKPSKSDIKGCGVMVLTKKHCA